VNAAASEPVTQNMQGVGSVPCFLRIFEAALGLLKTEYRIELTPEEIEEVETWLRERLGIAKEEKHEALKVKLESLKKERPNEFRKLEYDVIQFVKQLRRKGWVSSEREPADEKESKKDKGDKGRKKKTVLPMYT
jgi:hypothetical protein